MKKSSLNKISKITLLFLTVALIGSFCVQLVSSDYGQMVAQEFSHTKSASSNMMPCCEESSGHILATLDLPSTKYPLQVLGLLLMSIPASLILFANKFSKYSFSYYSLAPLGPDLLLTVIKKE